MGETSVNEATALRVLVITTVHVPLDARIHSRQIRSLRQAGHDVTFAAPFHATSTAPEAVIPGVATIDLPRAHGRHRLRALAAVRRLLRLEGPRHDVVLLHDPELLLAAVGLPCPRLVLDVHEDLAGSLADRSWIPTAVRPAAVALSWLLQRLAERRAALMLAESRYAERFRNPHPVVRNLPWTPEAELPAGTERRVVYIGRLSRLRGALDLVEVGRRLAAVDVVVDLVGPADADVMGALRAADGAGWIRWHGFEPNEVALERVPGALAGLSLLYDTPNYRVSLPTKLVEYLAHGVPVITTPLPEAAELVRRSGGGIMVDFGDVDAVVRAVAALASDPGRAAGLGAEGRRHVLAGLTWETESITFLSTLEDVVSQRGHR